MEKSAKIYVAGHKGLVGSAITRALQTQDYNNLVVRTHAELDLIDQKTVGEFFATEKPEYVFLAAAKVGGILANDTAPADFIYENLIIETNIIHEAYKNGVKKLLFLGSSCIYPKAAPQPLKEQSLLTGPLEKTNEAYAVAKITGVVMCQSYNRQYGTNFISVMPPNMYGPGDNFDPVKSHVLQGVMNKLHKAKIANEKTVTLWGTGTPRREFMHVDDLASACVFLMNNYNDSEIINVGPGVDLPVKDLAEKINEVVGFAGEIIWDTSKPNGVPQKLLEVSKLNALGWKPKISLEDGIKQLYEWYLTHEADAN